MLSICFPQFYLASSMENSLTSHKTWLIIYFYIKIFPVWNLDMVQEKRKRKIHTIFCGLYGLQKIQGRKFRGKELCWQMYSLIFSNKKKIKKRRRKENSKEFNSPFLKLPWLRNTIKKSFSFFSSNFYFSLVKPGFHTKTKCESLSSRKRAFRRLKI